VARHFVAMPLEWEVEPCPGACMWINAELKKYRMDLAQDIILVVFSLGAMEQWRDVSLAPRSTR